MVSYVLSCCQLDDYIVIIMLQNSAFLPDAEKLGRFLPFLKWWFDGRFGVSQSSSLRMGVSTSQGSGSEAALPQASPVREILTEKSTILHEQPLVEMVS